MVYRRMVKTSLPLAGITRNNFSNIHHRKVVPPPTVGPITSLVYIMLQA